MSNESNENHKTIADIVDEMRECADRMERRGLFDLRGCGTEYLRAHQPRLRRGAGVPELGAGLLLHSRPIYAPESGVKESDRRFYLLESHRSAFSQQNRA